MTYEQLKQLKPEAFKRRCGLQLETFNQMVEILNPHLDRKGKRGGQCKLSTGQIICTAFGKGTVHDFRLFKLDRLPMLPEQLCLADKGYQGLANLHSHSCLPTKKPRQKTLEWAERQHNRLLARLRIIALTC